MTIAHNREVNGQLALDVDNVHDGQNNDVKAGSERPVIQQKLFNEMYLHNRSPAESAIKKAASYFKNKSTCSGNVAWDFAKRRVPVLSWIPTYDFKINFVNDLVGGLIIGIMQIPQGMGYALLADMPPVMGLYVSFFAVLMYFFVGTSRHISQGTFSVVSLLTANAIHVWMENHPEYADHVMNQTSTAHVATEWDMNISTPLTISTVHDPKASLKTMKVTMAVCIAFLVGVSQILMSCLQLGNLAVYLSDNLVSGFTTGGAVHVLTSQLKYVFGIHVTNFRGFLGIFYTYKSIFLELHNTNLITFAIFACSTIVLCLVHDCINERYKTRLIVPIPVELFVVVITTVVSYCINLNEVYGVEIIKEIPIGLPFPEPPKFSMMQDIVISSIVIAIVDFCICISLAIIFAKKFAYDIDINQEMFAYGVCNLFGSFFTNFPCCASLSRTTVQVNSGAKTQLASLISITLVLVVLLAIGPYFEPIPVCVLSAIIIVALRKLFKQIGDFFAAWKISKSDAIIWMVTFWAVVICDVDYGLGVSLAFLLVVFLYKLQRPYTTVLGNVPNTETYLDLNKYKAPKEIKGFKIIQFGGALYFANREYFRRKLYKLVFCPQEEMLKRKKAAKNQAKNNSNSVATINSINEFSGSTLTMYSSNMTLPGDNSMTASTMTLQHRDIEEGSQTQSVKPENIYAIIIDFSAISFIDTPALSILSQLIKEYEAFNVAVCFAGCRDKVITKLERSEFYPKLEASMFPTIHDAVLHTLESRAENSLNSTNGNDSRNVLTQL
ncbi:hypothetical protein CHUAL_006669 [Chamberlinius hualienensis]